ncbi:MAG: CorA family divalent cation transporter [Deinococcaceae bacterium]
MHFIFFVRNPTKSVHITTNILTSMMGTFASVISNNVNAVVRLRTTTTILLAIPTLVSSAFGMNIPLPWHNDPKAFFWVMGLALGLSGLAHHPLLLLRV